MLRYKTETRPGLVTLYDIWPGNGAGPFLQPRSPHGATWDSSVFLGRQLHPRLKGWGQRPQIVRTSYMRAHSMRNNNQILHDDQTRCEENCYTFNHECWRAIFAVANFLVKIWKILRSVDNLIWNINRIHNDYFTVASFVKPQFVDAAWESVL